MPDASRTNELSLPHLDDTSEVHMVSVANKAISHRRALAVAHVVFSQPETLQLTRRHALKKGDVLAVARIAGIMAAKRTPDLVPLCHPGIAIEGIEVYIQPVDAATESGGSAVGEERDIGIEDAVGGDASVSASAARLKRELSQPLGHYGGIRIAVEAQCSGKTGVEMEALTGAMGAALTVVDMCKSADRGLVVGGAQVVRKEGGRSGLWTAEGWE